ncbi:hypothetical protein NQZ68_007578 [Dissostichus eleginoides]|nr:hypothetical protein NQZ68_007578 [Dissostichus eleginoides]
MDQRRHQTLIRPKDYGSGSDARYLNALQSQVAFLICMHADLNLINNLRDSEANAELQRWGEMIGTP